MSIGIIIAAIVAIGILIMLIHDHPVVFIIIALILVAAVVLFLVFQKKAKKKKEADEKQKEAERLAEAKERYQNAVRHENLYRENKIKEFNDIISSIPIIEPAKGDPVEKRSEEPPEFKTSGLTRNTNISSLFPIVIIDTETTGLSSRKNKLIEVSAIKVTEGFEIESAFSTLCNPVTPIPETVTKINNITDEMVKDAPLFSEIASSFAEYISGCTIAGYNITFDANFLWNNGIDFNPKKKMIDVMGLWKTKLKKKNFKNGDSGNYDVYDYKLSTVAEYFKIYRDDAHRSLSDCLATKMLLEEYIDEFLK